MGAMYNVEMNTINYNLKKVFSDSELEEDSVIQNFRITAVDGKNYNARHCNLQAIISAGLNWKFAQAFYTQLLGIKRN